MVEGMQTQTNSNDFKITLKYLEISLNVQFFAECACSSSVIVLCWFRSVKMLPVGRKKKEFQFVLRVTDEFELCDQRKFIFINVQAG